MSHLCDHDAFAACCWYVQRSCSETGWRKHFSSSWYPQVSNKSSVWSLFLCFLEKASKLYTIIWFTFVVWCVFKFMFFSFFKLHYTNCTVAIFFNDLCLSAILDHLETCYACYYQLVLAFQDKIIVLLVLIIIDNTLKLVVLTYLVVTFNWAGK